MTIDPAAPHCFGIRAGMNRREAFAVAGMIVGPQDGDPGARLFSVIYRQHIISVTADSVNAVPVNPRGPNYIYHGQTDAT